MRSETLTLTEARLKDLCRIRAFVLAAKSPNIVIHMPDIMSNAIKNGLLFKLENDAGELAAVSLVTPVGETKYLEMGNCLVAERYRGFGIQRLMIRARAAAVPVIMDSPTTLVVGVDPANNYVSFRNILKAGFKPLHPFPAALLEPCSGCMKRSNLPQGRLCCCDFFFLPLDNHQTLVEEFLDFGDGIVLSHGNGDRLMVKIASQNARDPQWRKLLEDFVQGFTWGYRHASGRG